LATWDSMTLCGRVPNPRRVSGQARETANPASGSIKNR
jgi:hypothetical protein